MADNNSNDIFGGIFDTIQTDLKKATDFTRNIPQVPISAGLDIKSWLRSKVESLNPFSKFAFKFLQGRVPFDQYEKNFMPKTPNLRPSSNPIGFDDVISVLENLFDDLSPEEEEDYQAIRYRVHLLIVEFESYIEDSSIMDVLDDYSEFDLVLLDEFYNNWPQRIDDSDASLRDQLIDLLAFMNSAIQSLVAIKLSTDRRTADLITFEVNSILDLSVQTETILNDYPVELETLVERLSNLLTYTPVSRVQRSRTSRISQIIKNPLFSFVRSDFLRAQTTSISPLATSFADKGNDVRNQIDAAQSAVGRDARMATPDVGGGDKIQQDGSTETIDPTGGVGPLADQDWMKLRKWLFQRESSSDYSKVNRFGFSGGYQMGGGALIDLGYARPGTKTSSLAAASNWTGKDGASSREAFLGDSKLQDSVVLAYHRLNYKRMLKAGTVSKEDSVAQVAGLLAVAHLLGSGGARDYKNGKNGSDANGTTGAEYFKGGSGAVGGAITATPEQASSNKQAVESNVLQDEAQVSVPSSSAASVYPYNRVRHFESGHFEEFDNTPGAERVQVRHKTGTGYEFQEDGTAVYFAKGDKYDAILGNNYIVVEGICNIYVKGNAGIVADGDINLNASNDINMFAGGDFNVRVNGKHSLSVDGSSNENIKGDSARLVGGFSKTAADGDIQIDGASISAISREGNMNLVSLGDIGIVTAGNYSMTASGDASSVSKGKTLTVSYGDQYIVAAAKMTINGTDLVTHGSASNLTSSAGQTSIASGGTIKLSHPVEKAEYSDTAGLANPGTPIPKTPSASSSDGGGGSVKSDNQKRPESEKTKKIVEQYNAQAFDKTMAYSGGGEGMEPSKVDPLSVA